MNRTGSAPARSDTPEYFAGRNPALHIRADIAWIGVRMLRANRVHDDERREILGHIAQAIGEPRSDARPSADHGSGLNVGDRGLVIDLLGIERLHDRDVVHHLRGVRQQLRYPGAAPAMLRELVDRRRDRETSSAPTSSSSAAVPGARIRQILVVPVLQAGLVVEQILLRRAAEHVHVDGALRLRREVRKIRQAADVTDRARGRRRSARHRARTSSPVRPRRGRAQSARKTAGAFRR